MVTGGAFFGGVGRAEPRIVGAGGGFQVGLAFLGAAAADGFVAEGDGWADEGLMVDEAAPLPSGAALVGTAGQILGSACE